MSRKHDIIVHLAILRNRVPTPEEHRRLRRMTIAELQALYREEKAK